MVVDDDPDIRAALRICLGSEGFEVQSCADGQDAINSLDAGALPQAMILDLMMPRMNGFEVLEALKLKADWSRIPVVVVSANRGYSAKDLGVLSVLRKPFELEELVGTLRAIAA